MKIINLSDRGGPLVAHLQRNRAFSFACPAEVCLLIRYTLAARALRYVAMSAAFVLIIVIPLLCVALLALVGILWAALHFDVGENDED
jgi:hypothetical protein